MTRNLTNLFPIWDTEKGFIISKTGEITAAFEVTKPEIFTNSGDRLEMLHQTIVRAVSILPPGCIVHFQDWYTTSTYQAQYEENDSFFHQCSEQYFQGRQGLDHRAFLFLSKRPKGKKPINSAASGLLRKTLVPSETLHPKAVQAFSEVVGPFIQILESSKLITLRRLEEEEIWSDNRKTGLLEQYFFLLRPNETSVTKDISFDDGIRIGNDHCILFALADLDHLPSTCSPSTGYAPYSTDRSTFPIGFATGLGPLLPCNHIYNQFLFTEDNQASILRLDSRRKRLSSLSKYSRSNAIAAEEINNLLQEVVSERRSIVKAHYNIFAWAPDRERLSDVRSKVTAVIAQMGASPHLESIGAPQIWWGCIPGNGSEMPYNEQSDLLVEQAVCLLGMETNYQSGNRSTAIRLGDRISGKPLWVDITEKPMQDGIIQNLNKIVFGGSGSGKSFYTNHLMRNYQEQGCHILIVDIGHSYKGLCQLVGGYYFTCSDTQLIRFNPFWLREGERPDIEKQESLQALLLALWKKDDELLIQSEQVTLSNALRDYYAWLAQHSDIFPCFNSFYDFLQKEFMPLLASEQVKDKEFDIHNFLYILRPYYKGGQYDYLLNAQENLDLFHQRLIVFELDAIKDHKILFPVVTIILMEVFIHKLRQHQGVRKVILIEEAWKAIARTGMSEYIKYLFKTVRKFYGEAIIVTQEMDDILSSPIVKQSIINNADCKILLDQSKFTNRFEQVQEVLGLTQHDATQVLSVNKANEPGRQYKEVFISLGNACSKVYRVEVSEEEYYVYTSKEPEKLQVAEYANKFGSFRKGIEALAEEMRKAGQKIRLILLLAAVAIIAPSQKGHAQISIIGDAIKRALMAADLHIQRLQTKTVYLQEVQKIAENMMERSHLADIRDWVERQKDLYAGFYQELWEVKDAILYYTRVKDMIEKQIRLVQDYRKAWSLVINSGHFNSGEIWYMASVYATLLDNTVQDISLIEGVIQSFLTQMSDGDRLRIIDEAGRRINRDYYAMEQFTQGNILINAQRDHDATELKILKSLYGTR